MPVALTLVVKNEEDIIGENLAFHLSRGVSDIFILDTGSTDNTIDIIRSHAERTGQVHLQTQRSGRFDQGAYMSALSQRAYESLGPESLWIINGDADEFWWPNLIPDDIEASLAFASAESQALAITRTNFLPAVNDGRPWWQRMTLRDETRRNTSGNPLRPKVIHRGAHDVHVEHGNLAVWGSSIERIGRFAGIEQLHFPMRSPEQFARKIGDGAAALRNTADLPSWVGGTWRRLDANDQEVARHHYDDLVRSANSFSGASAEGAVIRDLRLRDALNELSNARYQNSCTKNDRSTAIVIPMMDKNVDPRNLIAELERTLPVAIYVVSPMNPSDGNSRIQNIKTDQSTSLTSAWNIGTARALNDGHEKIVVIDPLADFGPRFGQELRPLLQTPNDSIIGIRPEAHDALIRIETHGGFSSSACVVLSRSDVDQLGLFNTSYGDNLKDALSDFAGRASLCHRRIAGVTSSAIQYRVNSISEKEPAAYEIPYGGVCSASLTLPDLELTSYARSGGEDVPWAGWKN